MADRETREDNGPDDHGARQLIRKLNREASVIRVLVRHANRTGPYPDVAIGMAWIGSKYVLNQGGSAHRAIEKGKERLRKFSPQVPDQN